MSALPADSGGIELPGSAHDYERFIEFLREFVGLDLEQYKRRQMERRIRAFASRRGIESLDAYQQIVRGDEDEMNALLDRITINVSQLFRNPEQWERIGADLVPDLLDAGQGRIRAWSAGCSFGAEAYSLAATALEVDPQARLEIRASDIDRRILAAAGRGEFTADDARSAPPHLMAQYFERTTIGWRVRPALLRAVKFMHEDLLATSHPAGSFDLVLCRNVVIYFTPEARIAVHEMLARTLRIGGYLVIGSTERVAQNLSDLGLEMAHPFVYRKVA